MHVVSIRTLVLIVALLMFSLASALNTLYTNANAGVAIAESEGGDSAMNLTSTETTTVVQTVTVTVTIPNTTVTKTESTTITHAIYHTIPLVSVVTVPVGLGTEQAIPIIAVLASISICVGYFVGFRFARERCVEEVAKKAKEVKRR